MADHTSWGVEVCKRVNSPRVKLLYDPNHAQTEAALKALVQKNWATSYRPPPAAGKAKERGAKRGSKKAT